MKNIKNAIFFAFFSVMALLQSACSDDAKEAPKESGDHVWKNQTDALKSAKEMTKKMQENIKQQQENMNNDN